MFWKSLRTSWLRLLVGYKSRSIQNNSNSNAKSTHFVYESFIIGIKVRDVDCLQQLTKKGISFGHLGDSRTTLPLPHRRFLKGTMPVLVEEGLAKAVQHPEVL